MTTKKAPHKWTMDFTYKYKYALIGVIFLFVGSQFHS